MLRWPAVTPIRLTRDNAGLYLNLLWPLGLANRMALNDESPVLGGYLTRFASTAGWTLGRESNGSVYFNKFPIIELTAPQESWPSPRQNRSSGRAATIRPFSGLQSRLGVVRPVAARGLAGSQRNELYQEALTFNSLWFPSSYVQTALYFKAVERLDWQDVDPRVALSYRYSAISPWIANVKTRLTQIPGLPQPQDRSSCSV